jgi:hypothetical protein
MFLDDPNELTLVVIDHIGLLKLQKIYLLKKMLLIKCQMNFDMLEIFMDTVLL